MGEAVPLLSLKAIARTFSGAAPTFALSHVDLEVVAGDFVAVVGPSGGGKSTLLNIIGLLDIPTGGEYRIADVPTQDLSELDRARIRRDQFAFIFQSFHLLDRRPVVDSVELGMLYQTTTPQSRRMRALEALSQVGLSDRAHHLAAELSGGERQRVAIARALASQAPIVIADEPTGNLDTVNSGQIMRLLRQLNATGTTVILVTHSPDIAAEASRVITIRDGTVVAHEPTPGSPRVPQGAGPSITQRESRPLTPTRGRLRHVRDILVDATASLRSRGGRTSRLAAAVGIGVALFVGTLGISASASTQVSGAFDAHTNRDVTASWNGSLATLLSNRERASMLKRLSTISGVDAVGIMTGTGQVTAQAGLARPKFDVDGFSITPDTAIAARLSVHWATDHRPRLGIGEVLIGRALAKKIELGPLEGTPIILVNNAPMTVAGVIETSPRFPQLLGGVVSPSTSLDAEARNQQQAVILTRPGAAQQVARQAPLVVYPYDTAKVAIDAPADPASLRIRVQQDLQFALLALTGIALLAAIAGLTNSMTASVLERTHEFGLRRAVGATSQQVRNLVLAEATLVGTVGGVLGLAVGLGGIVIITLIQQWSPVFDLILAPVAVVGGILVGISSGAISARRAANIQPQEALRS
ncbi:ABC transporter ATP-binding protein/permease [Leifsonia aquatica]|uniref:ABC transporter ATP-binding protein/permease n=1 Tax=Leifsonia aquatica TaxID=144185 RepID=UPI003804558A